MNPKNRNNKPSKNQPKTKRNPGPRKGAGGAMRDKEAEHSSNYGYQMSKVLDKGYGATLKMTPSCARFASVYSDPFKTESARLPAFPIVASQLVRCYTSGVGVLNANGNGYVTCIAGQSIMNDQWSAVYTSGAAAPDGMAWAALPGLSHAQSNSEFASTAFYAVADSFSRAFRPVAFGIRVRYTGTNLEAGGTCYTIQMQPRTTDDNLTGFTPSTIKQYPGFKEYTFRDDKWHSVTRHISTTEDTFYQQWNDAEPNPGGGTGLCQYTNIAQTSDPIGSFDCAPNIGIYMTGTAGQSYEFEVVGHYEVIGPNLSRRSIVQANTAGVEQVTGSYAQLRHKDTSTPDHSVGKPAASSGGWVDILKKGAEALLPMIPKVLGLLL